MHEQIEEQKENKSRLASNSVGAKKGSAKQGFGFVDNRSSFVAQGKPKNAGGNILQGQLLKVAPKISGTKQNTIQKKIDTNKFNVVGEKHDDYDKVNTRETEKEFIKNNYNIDKYWGEPELKYNDPKIGYEEVHGDSNILRFIYGLNEVSNALDRIVVDPRVKTMTTSEFKKSQAFLIKYIRKTIMEYINATEVEKLALKKSYSWLMSNLGWGVNPNYKVNGDIKEIASTTETNVKFGIGGAKREVEVHVNLMKIKGLSDKVMQVSKDMGGALKTEDARVDRSEQMIQTGNQLSSIPAVWKVGEKHAEDMEKSSSEKLFSLTSRGDFVTEKKMKS